MEAKRGKDGIRLCLTVDAGTVTAFGQQHFERSVSVDGGPFLRWSWDGVTLRANSDRFGLIPCFYAVLDGAFYIATSVAALLDAGIPADIDDDAVSCMLYFGQCIGDLTPFRHIRALPPGADLSWDRSGLSISGEPWIVAPDRLSRDQVIDGYIDLFRQSMQRHLAAVDDFVLPLTGGRDSRHIAFEAMTQNRSPRVALTAKYFNSNKDDDWRVAGNVCSELGLQHEVLDNEGAYIETEYAKFAEVEWLSLEHMFAFPIRRFLKTVPGVALFDGLAGDILSAGLYLTDERVKAVEAGKFEAAARLICRRAPEYFLAPEALKRWSYDRAVSIVAKELERHAAAGSPVSNFYFWSRTRRNVSLAPYHIYADEAWPVMTPYVTAELFSLLSSQPASLYLDHRLHDEVIARAYPQWAHIPYEKKVKGRPTPLGLTYATLFGLLRNRAVRRSPSLKQGKLILSAARSAILSPGADIWWDTPILYIASLEEMVSRRS